MNSKSFQDARDKLRALGVVLDSVPGQYRINMQKGTENTAYLTDDLQDALDHGYQMAAQLPAPEAPLGPMGSRSRRGMMYRHNRKVAARRASRRR